jgi:hypothetical protein
MQCNVEQHLLLDRGKSRKTLIELAGRRTFRMPTNFQPKFGIKYANLNISPYPVVALYENKFTYLLLQIFLFMCTLSMSNTHLYIPSAKTIQVHGCIHTHIYLFIYFFPLALQPQFGPWPTSMKLFRFTSVF